MISCSTNEIMKRIKYFNHIDRKAKKVFQTSVSCSIMMLLSKIHPSYEILWAWTAAPVLTLYIKSWSKASPCFKMVNCQLHFKIATCCWYVAAAVRLSEPDSPSAEGWDSLEWTDRVRPAHQPQSVTEETNTSPPTASSTKDIAPELPVMLHSPSKIKGSTCASV